MAFAGTENDMGTETLGTAESAIKTVEPMTKPAKDGHAALHGIDLEALMQDLGHKIEQTVKSAMAKVQARSKAYVETAETQIDTAQHYVAEQVKARPVTAMVTALGVGVVLGLLLNSGRKR
jgi:ElaB/YqjD/DUF883 family membrane-anchored ribosome-binding protein